MLKFEKHWSISFGRIIEIALGGRKRGPRSRDACEMDMSRAMELDAVEVAKASIKTSPVGGVTVLVGVKKS